MPEFSLTTSARQDMLDIWYYIATDDIDAADRIRDSILGAFSLIVENPGIGHTRQDLTRQPLRFWTVQNYHVIYSAEPDLIKIVRVLHGRRDIRAILRKHFRPT